MAELIQNSSQGQGQCPGVQRPTSARFEEEVVPNALRRKGRTPGPPPPVFATSGSPLAPVLLVLRKASLISYPVAPILISWLKIFWLKYTHTHTHTRHTPFKIVSRYREQISGFHWGERRGEGQDWGLGIRCRDYCVVCARSLQCVPLFVIPWTVACQALLSMGFFRQEY